MKQQYVEPDVRRIGTVQELTLANKDFKSPSDGILFKGQPILGSI